MQAQKPSCTNFQEVKQYPVSLYTLTLSHRVIGLQFVPRFCEKSCQVPTDQELYLICDVIGRAGEVEILDVDVPAAAPEAPAEVEVPAVVPAAPKVEVVAAVNPFLEIMQRRPPMYR